MKDLAFPAFDRRRGVMVLEPTDPPLVLPPPGAILIGRKEYLDFPEWDVRRIRVKIDTGAWTSALDVARCTVEEGNEGPVACLRLVLNRRSRRGVEVRAPVLRKVRVRNPNGGCEERPVVEVLVRLGPVQKRIPLAVTNRSDMRCRMILGRQALAGSFLVDVSRKYLLPTSRG
jgi:hypothetical protein